MKITYIVHYNFFDCIWDIRNNYSQNINCKIIIKENENNKFIHIAEIEDNKDHVVICVPSNMMENNLFKYKEKDLPKHILNQVIQSSQNEDLIIGYLTNKLNVNEFDESWLDEKMKLKIME